MFEAVITTLFFAVTYKWLVKKVEVYENHQGLLFNKNKFIKTLGPGHYRIRRYSSKVEIYDVRLRTNTMPNQELVTKDGLNVKVTLNLQYKITDLLKAHSETTSFFESLYALAQVQLRHLIANTNLDELLSEREGFSKQLTEGVRPKAIDLGLEVKEVLIRDVMLPADVKRAFSEVAKAQKEAQATLERARGEQAALRALNNAAQMIEKQPLLLNLRALQTVQKASTQNSNSLVMSLSDALLMPKITNKDTK